MDGEKNQHEVNMFACNLQRMNIMNDIIHLLMPADPALSSTLQRFPLRSYTVSAPLSSDSEF